MAKRKPVGSKLRFDIFKRDDFTCRYCGRSTPTVILEIDHVVPVADGGSNEPENLVTSCWECNRGKGATPLDTMPEGDEDIRERTILLAEREMQLREYNEVLRRIRQREDADIEDLLDYWAATWYLDRKYDRAFHFPKPTELRKSLQHIAAGDIRRAMTIAEGAQTTHTPSQGVKYLFAILHRWRREGTRN